MISLAILIILIFLAATFIILPERLFFSRDFRKLELDEKNTKDIVSIIMFVSKLNEDEAIEDLLSYKILNQMCKSSKNKSVWLIHSAISSENNSSYKNAYALYERFRKNKDIEIDTKAVVDIYNMEESFNVVNNILTSAKAKNILCDFTSGTKPMSLGMALACINDQRLVYFPKTDKNNAEKYLHINIKEFIE
jgi:hypothetical protein